MTPELLNCRQPGACLLVRRCRFLDAEGTVPGGSVSERTEVSLTQKSSYPFDPVVAVSGDSFSTGGIYGQFQGTDLGRSDHDFHQWKSARRCRLKREVSRRSGASGKRETEWK